MLSEPNDYLLLFEKNWKRGGVNLRTDQLAGSMVCKA